MKPAKKADQISRHILDLWNNPTQQQINQYACDELTKEKEKNLSFFQCNPYLISCAIKKLDQETGNHYKFVKTENNFLNYSLLAHEIFQRKISAYQFKIEENGETFSYFLLDRCHQRLLPSGSYLTRNEQEEEVVWDNHQQKIYLDQFYVSNLDIWWWDQTLLPQEDYLFSSPALNLTPDKMTEYCHTQGKVLAQSHILDAFAIPPSNFNKAFSKKLFYYPYVEDKDKNLPFFKDKKLKIQEPDCLKAYTSECTELLKLSEIDFYSTGSSSWSGVYFLQGFYPEYSSNIFFPDENLSLSSHLVSRLSPLINNGVRINKNKSKQVFDQLGIDQNQIKKAFRCMFIQ